MTCTRRHGSAALTAVTMVGLVGVTIAALAALFAAEARRTRDAASEAQLRQMLLAGTLVARERVGADPAPVGETAVQLPASLAAEGARLVVRLTPAPDGSARTIDIDATLGERRMSQTLSYVRREGRWELAGAVLGL